MDLKYIKNNDKNLKLVMEVKKKDNNLLVKELIFKRTGTKAIIC